MMQKFKLGTVEGVVNVRQEGSRIYVDHDHETSQFDMVTTQGGVALFDQGRVFNVTVGHEQGDRLELFVNGHSVPVDWLDERRFQGAGGSRAFGANREIRSVMPGRVIRLHVKEGDRLSAGDPLLVLEAMKMENEIRAIVSGTVKDILVQAGSSVETGGLLMRIDPEESAQA